jgi:hypothetical protein
MSAEAAVRSHKPSYFLVSVSTRENLELCILHGMAGFPSGENGAWTFCEIAEGDFISFLYGARAHNLYEVLKREALSDAFSLPPWKPLTFRETGRTYSFPYRLLLRPVRSFTELLVRTEFAYVAENLLLRGGYSKTHFQADQTTLQSVSEMGTLASRPVQPLALPEHSTFTPRFTRTKSLVKSPEVIRFRETILQSAIRRNLMVRDNLQTFLHQVGLKDIIADDLEILGEKALPEGHIDLLMKRRVPLGSALKIPIEVKTNRAQSKDLGQLQGYMKELQGECPLGVLIASDFGRSAIEEATKAGMKLIKYSMAADLKQTPTFQEISSGLTLTSMEA